MVTAEDKIEAAGSRVGGPYRSPASCLCVWPSSRPAITRFCHVISAAMREARLLCDFLPAATTASCFASTVVLAFAATVFRAKSQNLVFRS